MAGSVGESNSEPEFQVAPMIDVLLVLLIFFMSITTDQIMKVDRSISLPLAPDAKKRDNDLQNQTIVNVDWEPGASVAGVRFNTQPCEPLEQLAEYVKPLKEANPKLKIIIRADSTTPSVQVQHVIEQLANAGVDDISLSGRNR
jgi:biopolymer transport protein ExbD